jgi:hypothetical protein
MTSSEAGHSIPCAACIYPGGRSKVTYVCFAKKKKKKKWQLLCSILYMGQVFRNLGKTGLQKVAKEAPGV